jgi:hypothetical protein
LHWLSLGNYWQPIVNSLGLFAFLHKQKCKIMLFYHFENITCICMSMFRDPDLSWVQIIWTSGLMESSKTLPNYKHNGVFSTKQNYSFMAMQMTYREKCNTKTRKRLLHFFTHRLTNTLQSGKFATHSRDLGFWCSQCIYY